ncbi:TadE/TadG family type IV pilus assembly protein [Lentilitoribacter sp. EG35]|uniref:TadE/TadG family type IV pilus assembly protein n=1 Tax=Lentilitoribacter sp. EG35 TaxID=3234192 RepID=UPI0034604FF1
MKALPSDHKDLFEEQKTSNWKNKIQKLVKRLIRNEDAIGAVEFALLVPVLLLLYVGAVELSVAMTIDKKVSKASAITTDILSQGKTTDKAGLKEMVGVAQSIVAPYDASTLGMQVIGINIDSTGKPTISWSWNGTNAAPFPVGEEIVIPKAYEIPDTFLLKTTVDLDYNLLLLAPKKAGVNWDSKAITLSKEYYLHQREAEIITCSDC